MEIRIYTEGGGDSKTQKSDLRSGFDAFLSSLKDKVRESRGKWRCVPSGGRNNTYSDFIDAIDMHPDAEVFLLVDSEEPVKTNPKTFLIDREAKNGWERGEADLLEKSHLSCEQLAPGIEAVEIDADPYRSRQDCRSRHGHPT